jgi:hypothetical protein
MAELGDDYIGPRWLPEAEQARIWNDLLLGPKPRAVDADLKASLLADIGPDEAELVVGLLEIVERGPADFEKYLAELRAKYLDGSSGQSP